MNLVFRLSGETVDGCQVCCLGSQLARVITLLSKVLGEVTWYVTDVDAVGAGFQPPTQTLVPLGESHQLTDQLGQVDQFLRGVFLAVKIDVPEPQFRPDIETEDPIDADLGNAIVEIRAFDTTYIEVLTRERRIADFVAETFGVHAVSA